MPDQPGATPIKTSETPHARRVARVAVTLALLFAAFWVDRHLLPALIWAAILVIATGPMHRRVSNKLHPSGRMIVPALFTLALALLVLIPVGLGVAEAAKERADVLDWIASARANGVPVPQWLNNFPVGGNYLAGWWQKNLGTPHAASQQLSHFHAAAVHQTRIVGSNIVHRAVVFGLTLLAYFFLLRDQDLIVAQLRVAGDRLLGSTGERVGTQIVRSVRGTINGLVFVGLGEGAVMAIVYWIAGAPHPLLFGAVTAIAAMIPFGAVLIFAVAGLIVLAQGSATAAAAIIITGLVVVAVADHVVRPVLIGGATRLPFLLVLFGILGGVETLGLLGLFVGPAIMAALTMLWRDYVQGRPIETPAPGEEQLGEVSP